MAYGWEGERVRLAPLDVDRHLENCLRWMNDPVVTEWLAVGDFPLSRLAEQKWFESACAGSETNIVFAIETLDGRHLGTSGIHAIDWRNRVASTGSFLGEVGCWGQGYGTEAAQIRARYCFEVLGLRVLYSSCLDGNVRSLRMQQKAGYEVVGRKPMRYWKRGAWRDEILTAFVNPNL